MADTYTGALKARKIEQGAYSNSYATRFNEDMVDVFDAAIAGVLEIDIGSATTYALEAMQNGTLSETHYFHLRFVGTPASAVTVTVPASVASAKLYHAENQTGQVILVKYAATSGVYVQNGDTKKLLCDGSNVREAPDSATSTVCLSRYLGWDPTGGTSSVTAFNNALEMIYEQGANHTEASQIGGRIIVPNGIALVSSTVTIGLDNIEILGGHGATIRTNGAFPAITIDSTSLAKIYGVTIRGLRFTSTVTDRAAGSGAISAIDAEMLRILHCRFHLITEYGVRWEDVISGYLHMCDFDSGSWNNPGMAYGLLSVHNATSGNNASHISRSSFRRTNTAGVALLGGEAAASRREHSGNSIIACDFEHNYGTGLQLRRNRALDCRANWFENNGQSAASGLGHIMDISTDDDETATSGLGGSNCFASNVFGGHSAAHANFQHIGLAFQTNPIVEKNYFTAGIIGVTSNCRGFTLRNNWSSQGEPTLAGAIPTSAVIHDNFDGPTASAVSALRWIGSFADRDPRTRPLVLTNTADTTPSIIDSTIGRAKLIIFNHGSAVTVTDFDDALEGDTLTIVFANGNTTIQNTTGDNGVNLTGGANFVGSAKDVLKLVYIDSNGFTGRWFETGREVI